MAYKSGKGMRKNRRFESVPSRSTLEKAAEIDHELGLLEPKGREKRTLH